MNSIFIRKKGLKNAIKESNKENSGVNNFTSETKIEKPPQTTTKPKRLTRSSSTSKFEPSSQNQSNKYYQKNAIKESNKENSDVNNFTSETKIEKPPQTTTKPKRLTRSSSTSKFEPSSQNQSNKYYQKSKNTSNTSSNNFVSTGTSSTTFQNETNTRRTRSQSRTKAFDNTSTQVKSTRPPRNAAIKKIDTQTVNKNEEHVIAKNFAAINLNENNSQPTLKPTIESRKKQTSVPTIKVDSEKDELSKNDTSSDRKTGKLIINEKDELLNVCCDNKTIYTKSTSTPSGMRRKPLKKLDDISFIGKPE
jgi:hypothetical protein